MKTTLLILLVAVAAVAQAQPYRIGNGVKAPVVIAKSEPEYSEEARKAGATATVVVSVVINDQGRAENVKVLASAGMGLDESAVRTVETWQFRPGTKDDRPVPVFANIEVNFRLLSPGSSLVPRRIVFEDPSLPGRPVLKSAVKVALSAMARQEGQPPCVTVKALLGGDGHLSGIRLDPAVGEQTERELLNQLGRWTFEPANGTVRMEFCAPPTVAQR